MDFCSSTYMWGYENNEVYKEQGWKYKDVFNNIKCYQGRGDASTNQKILHYM